MKKLYSIHIQLFSSVLLMVCLLWCCPVSAYYQSVEGEVKDGVYHSVEGYSIKVPTFWRVVDRSMTDQMSSAVNDMMKGQNLPARRMDVMIEEQTLGASSNINVVVVEQSFKVNEANLSEVVKQYRQEMMSMGLRLAKFESKVTKVNGQPCFEFRNQVAMFGQMLAQRQYHIPTGSKTFIVTCTAPLHSRKMSGDAFDVAMSSFTIKGGFAFLGNLRELPAWMWGAIVGGLTGMVVGVVKYLIGRNRGEEDDVERVVDFSPPGVV